MKYHFGLPGVLGPAAFAAGAVNGVEVRDNLARFMAEAHERDTEHGAGAAAPAAAVDG